MIFKLLITQKIAQSLGICNSLLYEIIQINSVNFYYEFEIFIHRSK